MLRLLPLVALLAVPARADDAAPADPVLNALVEEALRVRPELAQVEAEIHAAQERVPQAQAMPDPTLQVGIQNDRFTKWMVGTMETSWVSVMASQTFPFPGKRALRGALADHDVQVRQVGAERVRLSTTAEVRRAYLALQAARERRALLEKLTAVWERSAAVALTRVETGVGAQSDVLRARLELARLGQRRRLLDVETKLAVQALNRLRHQPLDQALEPGVRLTALGFPPMPTEEAALEQARERSTELQTALHGVQRARQTHALAERAVLPDVTVGAGIMIRGLLEPMWTVTVGAPVPVFSGQRQSREVAESMARQQGAGHEVEAIEELIALRTHQRLEAWRALREVWDVTQQSLLPQAAEVAESTLTQFSTGRVSFASVLEANATSIAEADSALQVLAQAWQLAIAQDEASLADVGVGGGGLGGTSIPGAGAGAGSGGRSSSSSSSSSESSSGGGSSSMGM